MSTFIKTKRFNMGKNIYIYNHKGLTIALKPKEKKFNKNVIQIIMFIDFITWNLSVYF